MPSPAKHKKAAAGPDDISSRTIVSALEPASTFSARTDKYIQMCPAFFDELIKDREDLIMVDSIEIRVPAKTYRNQREDVWTLNHFPAQIWMINGHTEFLVFIHHQGKLFCVENILDAAKILEFALEVERSKLVS